MRLFRLNAVGTEEFRSTFPPGRYGPRRAPRPRQRWLAVSLLIVVLIAAGAVSWKLYSTYSANVIEVRVTAFSVVSEHQVHVQFQFTKDHDSAVTCIVRARARDGTEVGRANVVVPKDGSRTRSYALNTRKKAVTGEVLQCVRGEQAQTNSSSAR